MYTNINKRVCVNQDGPSLIIRAPLIRQRSIYFHIGSTFETLIINCCSLLYMSPVWWGTPWIPHTVTIDPQNETK